MEEVNGINVLSTCGVQEFEELLAFVLSPTHHIIYIH